MSDVPGTPAGGNAAGATPAAANSGSAAEDAAKAASSQKARNPAFKAMGLPRMRLPSRNWLIFWSVLGSIAGAITYDKYQVKRNSRKWCDLVSHLSKEPLDTHTLPRRVTVYLAAPPGDGLRSAREHFHNYIKPVLVAASMDWDVVEGRKEGDVRYKTAERIRRRRRRAGEGEGSAEVEDSESAVSGVRAKNGTKEEDGVAGDLVIGRHTWKEYIRGQHEGWLGPVEAPDAPDSRSPSLTAGGDHQLETTSVNDAAAEPASAEVGGLSVEARPDLSPGDEQQEPAPDQTQEVKSEEKEKPKPRQPPPYLLPSEYASATVSRNTPNIIGPAQVVQFPHILGFRNTPIRMYRFFTRRYLADSIGRDVATAVLASHRSFNETTVNNQAGLTGNETVLPEQADMLSYEEQDWWKKSVYRNREDHEESVWIEPMVFDERISGRMRKFELTREDEAHAKQKKTTSGKIVDSEG